MKTAISYDSVGSLTLARAAERPPARRLVTFFTAAAFHNRRAAERFDLRAIDAMHAAHGAWADAWDRVAAKLRGARDHGALARLADELKSEGAAGASTEWRAVCSHAASELSRLLARPV